MPFLSFCNLFGHKWYYKDFTNAMNSKGKKYNFTAIRKCKRCDKYEYKYAQWVDEKLVPKTDIDA